MGIVTPPTIFALLYIPVVGFGISFIFSVLFLALMFQEPPLGFERLETNL